MNRNKSHSLLRGMVIILVCLGLIACGGGNVITPPAENLDSQLQPVVPQTGDELPEGPTKPRTINVLAIQTPVLSGMSVGSEFEVKLTGEFSEEVYQGSFRLLFDSVLMQPVSATRGDLLHARMVHLAGLNESGFVPFSFTALPGDPAIEPASGELLSVRFRLLTTPTGSPRVRLQNDAAYLQLRDSAGKRLLFDLETVAGGAQ